jgi:DNA helicase-2/ATP-dependent DNA helicase PcrA
LQNISLLTDLDDEKDENKDKVKLMTIHSAKGLEFTSVFVVGLEENLFPSILSLNSREDLEEERRLFYVAITRAKKFLTLTYALTRFKFGQLNYNDESRFIEEIEEKNKQVFGQKKPDTAPKEKTFFDDEVVHE